MYVRQAASLLIVIVLFLFGNDVRVQAKEAAPTSEQRVVRLAAVGDVLLHEGLYNDARMDVDRYMFDHMFAAVKPYIEEADFAFVNQESNIGGTELGLSGYPSFNSPVEIADALLHTGFNVFNLANNHTFDHGERALQNALSYWDSLGVIRTGAYKSEEDRNTIRTFTKNGISFAVVSYTYGLNGYTQLEKPYLVPIIDRLQIEQDVKRAKQLADVVVAIVHFGKEYESLPNEEQKETAQFLADLGVSIVFGHHPHVLQPPAMLKGKDGNDTFVAYSLGNFLAGQEKEETWIGGIAAITVEKDESSRIHLSDPSFLPTFIYSDNKTNYKVLLLQDVTKEQYPLSLKRYTMIIQHLKTYIPTLRIASGCSLYKHQHTCGR